VTAGARGGLSEREAARAPPRPPPALRPAPLPPGPRLGPGCSRRARGRKEGSGRCRHLGEGGEGACVSGGPFEGRVAFPLPSSPLPLPRREAGPGLRRGVGVEARGPLTGLWWPLRWETAEIPPCLLGCGLRAAFPRPALGRCRRLGLPLAARRGPGSPFPSLPAPRTAASSRAGPGMPRTEVEAAVAVFSLTGGLSATCLRCLEGGKPYPDVW